jgi:asparagine synthase (glutamine-hydrolysing)
MCGIVGQVGGIGAADAADAVLRRQLALLRHRGPDDSGCVVDPDIAFGHTRLAIIDPEHGQQPFVSSDGKLVVTFNGEIYNYIELRDELRQRGHSFRTNSDTEVLLTGFREWGEGVVDRIDGMFAFAIFDRGTRQLFCARDPYGQKPFFYHVDARRIAFSSECRTFAELPGFRAEIDLGSVADFLAFESFPFDRSIYRGIRKLPPGHCLTYATGVVAVRQYFESIPSDAAISMSQAAVGAEVYELLRASVQRTFRADVPVGLLLSGGIDSSLVLALLRDIHPGVPLATFTIGNVDPSFDESQPAAAIAKTYGTSHTEVTAEPSALAAIARDLPGLLDEPQADPGILPKYMICREIGRTTKVALTGDGGDELFYGYEVFRAERLARYVKRVPHSLHRHVIAPLTRRLPASRKYLSVDIKLKQFAKGFPAPDHLRNFYWTSAFPQQELELLMRDERQDFADLFRKLDQLRTRWQQARGPVGRLAYLYQQQYLPDYVLANSDRASMLNSVELRTPFLARDLVQRVNNLPDSIKMRGAETKSLLRRIARDKLPREIARRRKKGFTAPVASLIAGELKDEVLEYLGPDYIRRQGLFRAEFVERLLSEHFTNRHNHYKPIWVLFVLQKWLYARRMSLP